MELQQIECSIVAILTDKVKESNDCNLKDLLQKEILAKNEPRRSSKKRTAVLKFPISTCDADEPCRISGRRTCLCPSTFVCEPFNNSFHTCVKLGYYRLLGL